jgi:exopolysaccharide biosynthesis polyprenyl glycosylphosphotransferase
MASVASLPLEDRERDLVDDPIAAYELEGESKATRRAQFRLALAFGDVIAIAAGISIASVFRVHGAIDDQVSRLLLAIVPLYLVMALHHRAYGFDSLARFTAGARRALTALFFTALVIMGLGFVLKMGADYSRVIVSMGFAIGSVGIVAFRYLFDRYRSRSFPDGLTEEIVLCDNTMLLPAGTERVINATALGMQPRLDCPHMLDRIGRTLRHADRVIIACAPEARQAWTAALKGLGISVEIMIPEVEALGVLSTRRYDGRLTAVVAQGPLGVRDQVMKRVFDLIVIAALLPPLLIVTGIVALLIKLDDGGPVFFVQNRIGQGNRLFRMYKFRSMRANQLDRDGIVSTARNDARVTRIGKLLRATSIDELPQLFNILQGDMSIVGPRPHALASTAEDQLFWDVDARYWWRHAAKPGLTGLAQVRGYRGATDTRDALSKRVQSDLEYLAGWSLLRDIRILFATIKVVLHPNAY